MPDTTETRPGNGQDVVEQARAEMQKAAQKAKEAANSAEEITKLVAKIKQEIKDAETPAKEAIEDETRVKIGRQATLTKKEEANKALRTIVRAATLAKEGIEVAPPAAQKLLMELADKSLSASTASAIEANLKEYLLGDKDIVLSSAGQPKSPFEQAFDTLRQTDPNAADLVADSLVKQADHFGRTADQMQEKFAVKKEEVEQAIKEAESAEQKQLEKRAFEGDWNQYYATYAFDREVIEALYTPSKFIDYVAKKRDKIAKPGMQQNEINRELTEKIKSDIGELFAKVYHRLDAEHATEFFEQIIRQDFFTGIERVSLDLKKRINAVRAYCIEHAEDDNIKKLGYFLKDAEEKPTTEVIKVKTGEKDENGKDIEVNKVREQLVPLIGSKKVGLADFMRYMDTLMQNYIDFRAYAHNARAVFLHPADPEKGFYAQLAGYAEKMRMINFDEMLLLPDADVFLRAFRLYDKYLDEQFASQDWIHTATMFTPAANELLSRFEFDVLEQLKNSFRDKDGNLTISEDKLRSAMAMAVGMSRGIFLNEVEKAAFADPALTEKGSPTFRSYYTVDDGPLRAFNPVMHFPFRFQMEGAGLNPIYFLPVEGLKPGVGGVWDHRELWKKMQAFRDSYLKGRKDIGDEQLFIDFCTNVGLIGGPFERKGWRTGSWFPNLYIYTLENNQIIDYLNTWKNLENIGYEALAYLVNQELNPSETGSPPPPQPDFLMKEDTKDYLYKTKRLELFEYIFEKYFDENPSQLNKYLEEIRKNIRPGLIEKIASGKLLLAESINERVELETSKIFLNRALARVVAQRFPTKFIRIDRDRLQKDGVSRYKKLRQSMGLRLDEFDQAVKDLLLAEDELRRNTSEEMRKQIKEGKKLFEQTDIEYRLSKQEEQEEQKGQKIRNLLKGKFITKEGKEDKARVDAAVALYNKLSDTYFKEESPDFLLDTFHEEIKKYKFTFGIEELDMSFVPFRGAGPRLLARAVGDISGIEQNLSRTIIQFPELLKKVSIDGKGDFSEIVAVIGKAKQTVAGIIGNDYAAQVAHHLAALTINYFKKDTIAKPLYGFFGFNRINSLAGEIAGRSTAVWEWDAREIDRFCIALESADILKRKPKLWTTSKPVYVSRYIKIPFTNKLIKFGTKRKPEISYTSSDLRREFGASTAHIAFEVANMVIPVILLFLLWQYIQKALKEGEGKK